MVESNRMYQTYEIIFYNHLFSLRPTKKGKDFIKLDCI
jgi:hypothetical protein